MTTTSVRASRPAVSVDELKRAWCAVQAGHFRRTNAIRPPRDSALCDGGPVPVWVPAPGERVVPLLGATGSTGASTLALALALAAEQHARVVECGPAIASGLASASTAELGLHATGWRQGNRDHVLLERTSELLASVDDVPTPTEAVHPNQLTILDVGWETSGVVTGSSWLRTAVNTAPALVMITTATVAGFRRLDAALELLETTRRTGTDGLGVAVMGPPRKKWPRGLEQAGGPTTHRVLAVSPVVDIPRHRDLAVAGLDSRPLPEPVVRAAARLLPLIERACIPTPAPGHLEGSQTWTL